MAGTVRTEIPVDHPPEVVWSTLLRSLAVSGARAADAPDHGTESVLLPQTDAMDAVDGDDPIPATLDHDRRCGAVDLSELPDVPEGLRAELALVPAEHGTTVLLDVTTAAWWGGAAARVARVGWLRQRVTGELEDRLRDVVRETIDLAVAADDEELRALVEGGTPTTQRLAAARRDRLEQR